MVKCNASIAGIFKKRALSLKYMEPVQNETLEIPPPFLGIMGDDKESQVIPLGEGRIFKQVNSQIIDLIK